MEHLIYQTIDFHFTEITEKLKVLVKSPKISAPCKRKLCEGRLHFYDLLTELKAELDKPEEEVTTPEAETAPAGGDN